MREAAGMIAIFSIVIFWVVPSMYATTPHKEDGFTISCPNGWIVIPKDVIDAQQEEVASYVPEAAANNYLTGFQLEGAKKWFEYPYILVLVNTQGRIPESQLEKMDEYPLQERLDKDKEKFSPIMSDFKVGKMYYNKQLKIIWLRMQSNLTVVGPITGISAMIPTEKGYILVSGYSLEPEFKAHESTFQTVAMSVIPDSDLAYKPKWSDSLPSAISGINWGKVGEKALYGAIIGGIYGLLSMLWRKKNKEK